MSRPAPPRPATAVCWVLVAAAVLVQIVYPLTPQALRTPVTVLSVLVFAAASLADVARVHGPRGVVALLAVAGGGGLGVEAAGVATGLPFGAYAYTGTLGPELLGVPLVVPLAWTMMAWPSLVVGRSLARGPAGVALAGGFALAAWDVFLDPQMVAAGHWRWADPFPALPLVPGVPLSNYAGWLVVAVTMVAVLHRALGSGHRPSGPAAALYLWTYFSSVLAHAAFFGLPGSAVAGAVVMGLVALPFARLTGSRLLGRDAPEPPNAPAAGPGPRRGRVSRRRRDRSTATGGPTAIPGGVRETAGTRSSRRRAPSER